MKTCSNYTNLSPLLHKVGLWKLLIVDRNSFTDIRFLYTGHKKLVHKTHNKFSAVLTMSNNLVYLILALKVTFETDLNYMIDEVIT